MCYEGAVSVAALKNSGKRAEFSNYGDCIGISAPGHPVLSTVVGGGYDEFSGTSMACPPLRCLRSVFRSTRRQQKDLLDCAYSTATNIDDLNPGFEGKLGAGMIAPMRF